MYIEDIASVYEEEELHFSTDEEHQRIDFKMNTRVSQDVPFRVRIANERTVIFETRLPMNIPEQYRETVSSYLTRANFGLWVGSFQMDFKDGELLYEAAGCHEDGEALPDDVIRRLTYVGFNMFDDYIPGVFAIVYGGRDAATAYQEVEKAIEQRRRQQEDGTE